MGRDDPRYDRKQTMEDGRWKNDGTPSHTFTHLTDGGEARSDRIDHLLVGAVTTDIPNGACITDVGEASDRTSGESLLSTEVVGLVSVRAAIEIRIQIVRRWNDLPKQWQGEGQGE